MPKFEIIGAEDWDYGPYGLENRVKTLTIKVTNDDGTTKEIEFRTTPKRR